MSPESLRSSVLDSKRRFTVAIVIGLVVAAVPYTWVLFDLWNGSFDLLRTAQSNGYASNFYDLQARAIFHGHLWVANGALGGEAFVHAGRQYTYFGLFPSFLRMPVLALTHGLDGRLTAFSMLGAWLVTAAFTSLLVWRVRLLVRGTLAIGRMEAASYGVLVAAIMGGSVLVYLASDPFVFSEDLAWSVALAVGSLFALLGVLERPSWSRVLACGALILAGNLTRATTGYACVIGSVLVAMWFILGSDQDSNRRWALPVLMAGLVPLVVACSISYAKFGIFFGLPTSEQVVFQTFGVGHVNNGKYFGFHFLPSTLVAYFQPGGLRLTSVFPFCDGPIGFGSIGRRHCFIRRRSHRECAFLDATALPGLSVGCGQHLSASTSGTIQRAPDRAPCRPDCRRHRDDLWMDLRPVRRRFPPLPHPGQRGGHRRCLATVGKVEAEGVCSLMLALMTAIAAFEIVANVGIASAPQGEWSSNQTLHYVQFQKSISDVTGHPLARMLCTATRCRSMRRPIGCSSLVTVPVSTFPMAGVRRTAKVLFSMQWTCRLHGSR